ncbi:MAG: acyl-CoA dehydrogenase, partial [Bacteroidetes bacterium QH_2_67_10]
FWLVTARQERGGGDLGRDIDFFILDQDDPEQCVDVEERFHNLGLYAIPYGRNRVNVTVPEAHKLEPETMGIKMMLDTLHRSRTEFPGMGMGFLRRMLDEAMAHCKERFVGQKSLFERDQVKKRLSRIQAYFTTCSAMCAYASEHAGIENNLATSTVSSNSVKAVVTDIMHDAAQSFLQLTGAKGYRLDHLAGRATVDSRPFQIFEGSNDVLYAQISKAVLKQMKRAKEKNLSNFLSEYEMTSRAAKRFSGALDFEVDYQMPQRKLVDLGRAIGRVVSMDLVIELGDRGFRGDLVSGSLEVLKQDAEAILTTYQQNGVAGVVEDYVEDSSWLEFVS